MSVPNLRKQFTMRPTMMQETKETLGERVSGGNFGPTTIDLTKAPYPLKAGRVGREGDFKCEILPIKTGNPMNPMIRAGKVRMGEFHFHIELWQHTIKRAGTFGTKVLCLKQFGRPCVACEEFFSYKDANPGSTDNPYTSSLRSYMLWRQWENGKPGPVEFLDASGRDFTKPLVAAANRCRNGDPVRDFSHPENGHYITFASTPGTMRNKKGEVLNYVAGDFTFDERKPDDGWDLAEAKSFELDTLLVIPTTEEMSRIVYGGPEDDDTQTQHSRTEPKEDGMDPDAFGAPKPEASKEPEEAPEEKPTKVEATPAPVEPKAPEGASKCPYGHAYGTDWGDTPDCKMCRRTHKDLEAVCADGGN